MIFKEEQNKLENQKNLLKELAEKEIRKICSNLKIKFSCNIDNVAISLLMKDIEGYSQIIVLTVEDKNSLSDYDLSKENIQSIEEIFNIYEYCIKNNICLDFEVVDIELQEIL